MGDGLGAAIFGIAVVLLVAVLLAHYFPIT